MLYCLDKFLRWQKQDCTSFFSAAQSLCCYWTRHQDSLQEAWSGLARFVLLCVGSQLQKPLLGRNLAANNIVTSSFSCHIGSCNQFSMPGCHQHWNERKHHLNEWYESMHSKKKGSLKTDPCRTPYSKRAIDNELLMETWNLLFVRHEEKPFNAVPDYFTQFLSFSKKVLHCIDCIGSSDKAQKNIDWTLLNICSH